MFDLEELDKLKRIGARRVRYADGAEIEFDTFRMLQPGAQPQDEASHGETVPLEQMPSRAELRKLAEGLAPPEVASE